MKILADEARAFFEHPTQRRAGDIDPADLHDNGIEYYAFGPVCGAFHRAAWPGVWMAHVGAKPGAWGKSVPLARAAIAEFWREHDPSRLIAWTKEENRAVNSFARRLGFVEDGRMVMRGETVIMWGVSAWA